MIHEIKLLNDNKVPLPKKWISKFSVKEVTMEEKNGWIFIKPKKRISWVEYGTLEDDNVELYDNWNWVRFEKWVKPQHLIDKIKKMYG